MYKFPVIELVDRWCIAKLKYDKIGNNKEELDFYSEQLKDLDVESIKEDLHSLYEIHKKVWEIEDEFKKYKVESKYDLEEIGRRALLVRDMMQSRYTLKNKIAEKLNDPIKERKNYGDVYKL